MPKEILNLKEKPLSIDNLLAIEKKLIDSPFEFIDIINFSVNDLVFMRRAISVSSEKEGGFGAAETLQEKPEPDTTPEAPQLGGNKTDNEGDSDV